MKSYAFISLLLLSAAVSDVGAQELSKEPELSANRPLNLSVRKSAVPVTDAVVLPIDTEAKSNNQTQSGSTGSEAADAQFGMPYGAGYENRQQGAMAGSRNSGSGKSDGKSDGHSGGKSSGGEGKGGGGGEGGGSGGRGGSGRGS
jgi:hypothetical protein